MLKKISKISSWINLIRYFLIKDIKSRFAGSALGLLWVLLLPIFQIAIYWFVFSHIMRIRPYTDSNMPYIYFLLSGFFFWTSFAESLSRSASCILENSELVKKVQFDNSVLPVTSVLSSYINNSFGITFFLIFYCINGYYQPYTFLFIPLLILQILFTIGLSFIAAAVIPYFRDLLQIIGYSLQGLFFLTPVIYNLEAIPERFRHLTYINPMTLFIDSYHKVILEGRFPDSYIILSIVLITIVFLTIGVKVFNRLKEGFADIL